MSNFKRVRDSDPAFLDAMRQIPCLVCRKPGSEPHHIRTKGSGGDDSAWNVIPLCPDHHTLGSDAWHRNETRFLTRFPWVAAHLKKLGWRIRVKNGMCDFWHPEERRIDQIGGVG